MDILKHPLFLLAVSAIISGIFIPWFLRRRQYKQKELELKTEIVSDITESVMKTITTIYLFRTLNFGKESLKKTLKDWQVRSCVICTKLHSYFTEKKKDEKDLSDKFKDGLGEFYPSNMDIKKEKDEKDLRGKWDMFKDVLSNFYEHYMENKEVNEKEKLDEEKKKLDEVKRHLFDWKHEIIKEILASEITAFR